MTNFFAAIGVVIVTVPAILGIALLSVIWRSWWLYPAWHWFLVPLGLPPISFWHFAALLMCVDTLKSNDTKKDERKTEWGLVVILWSWPILAWVLLYWMAGRVA